MACAGRLLQAARCPAPVLAARWSEASITMLTPAGGAILLTHLVPGAPHPVVRLRVGGMTMYHDCVGTDPPRSSMGCTGWQPSSSVSQSAAVIHSPKWGLPNSTCCQAFALAAKASAACEVHWGLRRVLTAAPLLCAALWRAGRRGSAADHSGGV
jgi:hypothetical protein